MGRIRKRRLLAKIRVVGTKFLFAVWTISTIGLGTVLGWIFFAEPHKLGSADIGNLAEITAALATVIVGIGAWKYARVTYEFNLARERRLARSAYGSMAMKCAAIGTTAVNLDHYLTKPAEEMTFGSWINVLKVDLDVLAAHTMTEGELSFLDEPAIKTHADMTYAIGGYVGMANIWLAAESPEKAEVLFLPKRRDSFDRIHERAKEIDAYADQLRNQIIVLRNTEKLIKGIH